MNDVSLFIGRFQPFHKGHLFVLNHCPTDLVRIGVGSSQYHHTMDNPFTFEERKSMIHTGLEHEFDGEYEVYEIPDIHDPPKWVDHVERLLPPFSIVLTNNEFTAELFKKKGYTITEPGLLDRDRYRGKEIRIRMIKNQPWEHLVPSDVVSYLNEIDAVDRLHQLSKK